MSNFNKIITAASLFISLGAHANVEKIEKDFVSCQKKARSTSEDHVCTNKAYEAANELLNNYYQKTITRLQTHSDELNKEYLKHLINSEKIWDDFKVANCDLQGVKYFGANGQTSQITTCHYNTIISRIKELLQLFEDEY